MPKMKRREFLQSAAAAGSSFLPATGIQSVSEKKAAKAQPPNLPSDILPMRSYLSQHDLVYEVAPREWEEGIPLGNGDMGALIWGDGNPLRITLDKYDVWETRSHWPTDPRYNYKGLRELIDAKQFDEAERIFMEEGRDPKNPAPTRLPMPRMQFDFGEQPRAYTARLDLYNATATGTLSLAAGALSWSAFVHSDKNVLLVRFKLPEGVQLKRLKVSLDHLDEAARQRLAGMGYAPPETGSTGAKSWLEQRLPANGRYVVMYEQAAKGPELSVYVTIVYKPDDSDPKPEAERNLNEAAKETAGELLTGHTRFWHEHWQRSFLTIPDPKLENLFYVEMYKLGCCSRYDKFPISLQGIWTKDGSLPPWAGDYHLDMNVQESYWPVYASNHLDAGQPLYERFFQNLPRYKKMCRDFFGFEGAHARCEQALDGSPIFGWYTANFFPGCGAWLALHYWTHWLYSRDKNFLRERAYPFMRPFMQTYSNLLEDGPDGRLHIPLDSSPEFAGDSGAAWGHDVTGELALIRKLAGALIEACEILGISDPDLPRWREILARLVEYAQDSSGLLLWPGQPLTESHRHFTHLMAIHPLGIINIEGSDSDRKLIADSLATIRWKGTGAWTGWSFPWMSLIASRSGEPYMACNMLEEYLRFISCNTFHMNGDPRHFGDSGFDYKPVTLEAGFAFAAALMEMLLQSWDGKIRVFPALPEFWPAAYFEKLRAEGAFLVTARRERGQTQFVEITSEAGEICRLKNPFAGQEVILNETGAGQQKLQGNWLEFKTEVGKKYLLTLASATQMRSSQPAFRPATPEMSNWFGTKKLARF
jgi:alpha-L-fucosidase 2